MLIVTVCILTVTKADIVAVDQELQNQVPTGVQVGHNQTWETSRLKAAAGAKGKEDWRLTHLPGFEENKNFVCSFWLLNVDDASCKFKIAQIIESPDKAFEYLVCDSPAVPQ